MANCKECICYESCKDWAEQYEDKEFPYRECRFFKSKADVVEVKHGEWKQTEEPLGWQDVNCIECSACGESWIMDDDLSLDEYVESWKHCPNCGAKMDERKEK